MEFETERLYLKEATLADAEFIFRLMNSPLWIQNIGDRGIKTIADAEKYIQEKYINNYIAHGYGSYILFLKDGLIPIGNCGVFKREGLEVADIGFSLLADYERKGYAYEAAYEILNFAKNILKFPKVCAIALPQNTPSIKLIEKLGLRYQSEIRLENDSETLALYAIDFSTSL